MRTMRKRSPIRRRLIEPMPPAALDALQRGSPDEQRDALRTSVPSVQELMDAPEFQQTFAKASQPRMGVAMAQVDIGGEGQEHLPLYRPVGLDFESCRQFCDQFLPAEMIIKRRTEQVKRFMVRPKYDWQPGFSFRFADEGRQVRDEDKPRFAWLRRYLMNGGAEFDPRQRRAMNRDNLMVFTAKHLRDSLSMDHAPVEIIPTLSGRPHGFQATDAARIYLTDPNEGLRGEYTGPAEFNVLTQRTRIGDPRNIVAVYERDGQILADYTHLDLMLPVRNHTSDERYFGYGRAEPDTILRIGTAFLDAMTVNARNISDNSIPRGLLNLVGEYDQKDLAHLRMVMSGQARGAANRWRMLTMNTPPGDGNGVSFVPLGGLVDEAIYSRWITLLVAITCGVYLIDPVEIGFESFTASTTSALSGSDTEAKLTSSTDTGLHSLLTWYAQTLNEIVQVVDPDVELYLTGLDDNKDDAANRESSLMTMREAREIHGMSQDDMPDELLDAPLNPGLMQVYVMTLQAKQQEQAGAQPGQDGSAAQAQDPQEGSGPASPSKGQSDAAEPSAAQGPDGERRFQDHQGQVWQVGHDQALAKADQPPVFAYMWPEEDR